MRIRRQEDQEKEQERLGLGARKIWIGSQEDRNLEPVLEESGD